MQKRTKDTLTLLEGFAHDAQKEICIPLASVNTPEKIASVKALLDKWGVVFITDAVDRDSIARVENNLNRVMKEMFGQNVDTLQDWDKFRSPKYGFGNCSFGYINGQYLAREDMPRPIIDGEQVYVTPQSIYSKVTLPFLEEEGNRHLLAVLLALTNVNGQVSIDSVKYAGSDEAKRPAGMTKQTLTIPHVDIYDSEILRFQAMVVDESLIKLGYVPGSDREEIRERLGVGKPTQGFISLEKEAAALSKGWLAPPTRSLVLWKSGVCHFEARAKPCKDSPAFCFDNFSDLQGLNKRLRIIVGTHVPKGQSREGLAQLAILAEHGAVPDFYSTNTKCTKLWPNIVCRKTTQFKVPRILSGGQKEALAKAARKAEEGTEEDLSRLVSPLKMHLYGLSQPLNELPFDQSDLALLLN